MITAYIEKFKKTGEMWLTVMHDDEESSFPIREDEVQPILQACINWLDRKQYIKKKITNTSFISVGKGRIIIHISCGNSAESQYTYYHRVEIGLNEAFKDFINNFDSGLYPKLIRNL